MIDAAAPSSPGSPPPRLGPVEAPPLLPLARFGVVFGWGLRRLFRTKKFLWTGILAVGLGVLAGLSIAGSRDPAGGLWHFLGTPFLGVCVPVIALALTAGGFGEEVADQTLVFHLVRPVSRTTLYVARFAAGLGPAIAATAAMALVSIVLSGVGVSVGTIGATVFAAAVGTTVVGAVYYALAALFRRGLVAGLLYTFVIEGFFQFIPGSVQKLALTHHVRSLFHQLCDADFAGLSQRVADRLKGRGNPFDPQRGLRGFIKNEPWSSVSGGLLVCGIVAVLALVLGARTIRRRDFALKD
jgi:ABC-type transport system involved in multi-copper enzyme maturation permease subunit